MSRLVPNSFQISNVIVDDLLSSLTGNKRYEALTQNRNHQSILLGLVEPENNTANL